MTRDEQWLLEEKYGGFVNTHFEEDCRRLAAGEPVAYVIGHQPFLGLTIYLDSHPLIPRPETEWWTREMLAQTTSPEPTRQFSVVGLGQAARSATENWRVGGGPLHCFDLCAGSGAIGCAMLARLPEAQVYFGEIDPAHEATIRKNIEMNHLDAARAHISIGDLFTPFAGQRFDLIACNPPYIPKDRALEKSVADYEPALALRSGTDGLDLIRRIVRELPEHLSKGGEAWIECDRAHAAAACALFAASGMQAVIRTDQYGVPRVVVVSFS